MAQPEWVDIAQLPEDLAARVRAAERRRLLHHSTLLTYHEAAELYGYSYQSIRHYVAHGDLVPVVLPDGEKRLTHNLMLAYVNGKIKAGAPRKAERVA